MHVVGLLRFHACLILISIFILTPSVNAFRYQNFSSLPAETMESDSDAVLTFPRQPTLTLTPNVACGLALAPLNSHSCAYLPFQALLIYSESGCWSVSLGRPCAGFDCHPLGTPREECLTWPLPRHVVWPDQWLLHKWSASAWLRKHFPWVKILLVARNFD